MEKIAAAFTAVLTRDKTDFRTHKTQAGLTILRSLREDETKVKYNIYQAYSSAIMNLAETQEIANPANRFVYGEELTRKFTRWQEKIGADYRRVANIYLLLNLEPDAFDKIVKASQQQEDRARSLLPTADTSPEDWETLLKLVLSKKDEIDLQRFKYLPEKTRLIKIIDDIKKKNALLPTKKRLKVNELRTLTELRQILIKPCEALFTPAFRKNR